MAEDHGKNKAGKGIHKDTGNKKRNQQEYLNLHRFISQNHFRTQKAKIDPEKLKENPAEYLLKDLLETNILGWLKHYFSSRFGRKHKYLDYRNSKDDNGIYKLTSPEKEKPVRIILVSDWATDTTESDEIGSRMQEHNPHYTIHLGDTYFVGYSEEVKNNFINDTSSWVKGSSGTFALIGNHEMYSRGIAYFRDLLPHMGEKNNLSGKYKGQKAAFFCIENDSWRIIGLDTGYTSVGIPVIEMIPWFSPECELKDELLDWLRNTVKPQDDNRGLIFLSHHQYCSAFEKDYNIFAEQLAEIIGTEREVLWFWGHEHRMAMYGKYQNRKGVTCYGRCIGHGGMPVELPEMVKKNRAEKSNLILYDNRFNKMIGKERIGYNGYVVLEISANILSVNYYDNKDLLLTEKWNYNSESGSIEGMDIISYCDELSCYSANIQNAIR